MVDFFRELPNIFRKRYLETHERYLKSIADVAAHLYPKKGGNSKRVCLAMVGNMLSAGNFTESMADKEFESPHFRNLRNSWYHEVALNNPHDNLDERLKFAPWKIIQCYYSVFSGISSLIRCFHRFRRLSHDSVLNIFGNEFLRNRKRKIFFLPPFNFHLNQQGRFDTAFEKAVGWKYATEYHIPNIKECLKSVHEKGHVTTILHYFKKLRDWVQYEDSYLFFRLYGERVKEYLDFSLSKITFGYLAQIEFFLINLFRWTTVKLQFDTFRRELEQNLKIEPMNLIQRFKVYEDCLSNNLNTH